MGGLQAQGAAGAPERELGCHPELVRAVGLAVAAEDLHVDPVARERDPDGVCGVCGSGSKGEALPARWLREDTLPFLRLGHDVREVAQRRDHGDPRGVDVELSPPARAVGGRDGADPRGVSGGGALGAGGGPEVRLVRALRTGVARDAVGGRAGDAAADAAARGEGGAAVGVFVGGHALAAAAGNGPRARRGGVLGAGGAGVRAGGSLEEARGTGVAGPGRPGVSGVAPAGGREVRERLVEGAVGGAADAGHVAGHVLGPRVEAADAGRAAGLAGLVGRVAQTGSLLCGGLSERDGVLRACCAELVAGPGLERVVRAGRAELIGRDPPARVAWEAGALAQGPQPPPEGLARGGGASGACQGRAVLEVVGGAELDLVRRP